MLHKLKIRILQVEDTPIHEIGPYFFLGVNKTLQELHIINTKLQKYPEDAFKVSRKGMRWMGCNFFFAKVS